MRAAGLASDNIGDIEYDEFEEIAWIFIQMLSEIHGWNPNAWVKSKCMGEIHEILTHFIMGEMKYIRGGNDSKKNQ